MHEGNCLLWCQSQRPGWVMFSKGDYALVTTWLIQLARCLFMTVWNQDWLHLLVYNWMLKCFDQQSEGAWLSAPSHKGKRSMWRGQLKPIAKAYS